MAKLLIVDDDAATRAFLSLAMQRDGHQVVEARTGEECLAVAQQDYQDIVLLDAQMPIMDGFTCCAELKATLGDTCPPVIIITGLADKKSVDRAFSVGAIDYATKPIHMAVLRHRVRQVLKERELRNQLAAINQQLAAANRELQKLARIDSLTQVANRRYFEEMLEREWNRLARSQEPLGILLCDLDFFKQYNDTYGHLAGDRCLKDICSALKHSVQRPADLIARYGGEEFVVLLPNTDIPGTLAVAERIHQVIRNMAIPHVGSQTSDTVTMSIGAAAMIPDLSHHPAKLVDIADRALYSAKHRGRNQTVLQP